MSYNTLYKLESTMKLINTIIILVFLVVTLPSFTKAEENRYIPIPDDSLRQSVPPEILAMTNDEILDAASYFAQTIREQQEKGMFGNLVNMGFIPENLKPPPAPKRRAKRSADGRDLPMVSADQISSQVGGQLPMTETSDFYLRKNGYVNLVDAVIRSQREREELVRNKLDEPESLPGLKRVKRNPNYSAPGASGSPKEEVPVGYIDQKKIFGR